jgi:Mn2+/Fe2+ NRAMP family transporter
MPHPHRAPGRHTHWRLARRRHRLLRAGGLAALLAVIGPGILAGLSDDDPAGITTISILGARYGYELLWVLAVGVSLLVLRESFHRLEHLLLALSAVFVAYVVAGFLAHPDWGAAGEGLVVRSIPLNRDAVLVAVVTVGTTLAPWGLAFIHSYAVDKQLRVQDLRYERIDVMVGAVLTGVIGFFVVACAATLHTQGIDIEEASDAARALEPVAGEGAATLFGLGFLGAALLAAAIVPLSTAYSLAADHELMDENALGRFDRVATAVALAVVAISVAALGVLAVL